MLKNIVSKALNFFRSIKKEKQEVGLIVQHY